MTEAEWKRATNPDAVLAALGHPAGDRKLRLFAVACCRAVWPLLAGGPGRAVVELAERYADGDTTDDDLWAGVVRLNAYQGADRRHVTSRTGACLWAGWVPRWGKADLPSAVGRVARFAAAAGGKGHRATQAATARCIFGNPFRPVTFDPRWRSADAVGLARGIYDDRAFDRLLLLADALMDAGCSDEQIIAHCRGDGPHARGCWVMDLILGLE